MTGETLERDDAQGLIVRAYGHLRAACYVLGRISEPARARDWLGRIDVTGGGAEKGDDAVNVAFTAEGLDALGLAPDVTAQFSREFLEGMVTAHRSRVLGDVEESAPERWSWGAAAPVHVLLMLFASDQGALARLVDSQERALESGGVEVVDRLDTVELSDREHFGFRDGLSQPAIPLEGGGSKRVPDRDLIATGEIVLGYPNAYGSFTHRPLVDPARDRGGILPADAEGSGQRDLARNGSYLVFRQLSQDVDGFWAYCREATGSAGDDAAQRLAAKMIGRWPSGTPLVLAPDADRPVEEANDFAYFAADPHGERCPIGAHVRRANPRDTLDPTPGTDRSVAVNKRHRLLRRGRKYGDDAAAERGLHFICLVANLSRQFEFVQHSWLNDPQFNGLYDQPDPLMAPAPPLGRSFTAATGTVRERYTGLPRFVQVRGGAYFFLPGLRALRYLAEAGG